MEGATELPLLAMEGAAELPPPAMEGPRGARPLSPARQTEVTPSNRDDPSHIFHHPYDSKANSIEFGIVPSFEQRIIHLFFFEKQISLTRGSNTASRHET